MDVVDEVETVDAVQIDYHVSGLMSHSIADHMNHVTTLVSFVKNLNSDINIKPHSRTKSQPFRAPVSLHAHANARQDQASAGQSGTLRAMPDDERTSTCTLPASVPTRGHQCEPN